MSTYISGTREGILRCDIDRRSSRPRLWLEGCLGNFSWGSERVCVGILLFVARSVQGIQFPSINGGHSPVTYLANGICGALK